MTTFEFLHRKYFEYGGGGRFELKAVLGVV